MFTTLSLKRSTYNIQCTIYIKISSHETKVTTKLYNERRTAAGEAHTHMHIQTQTQTDMNILECLIGRSNARFVSLNPFVILIASARIHTRIQKSTHALIEFLYARLTISKYRITVNVYEFVLCCVVM